MSRSASTARPRHTTTARLLRTPHPEVDESLAGYILRLAEANAYPSPSWVLSLAGLGSQPLGLGWRRLCGPNADYARLGRIARLSDSQLGKLTDPYRFASGCGRDPLLPDWGLPTSLVRFRHPQVCPTCLREAPYCRATWDFLPVTVCFAHRSLLVDSCHHCGKPLSWNRSHVAHCPCGGRLSDQLAPDLSDTQRHAGRLLAEALDGTAPGAPFLAPPGASSRARIFGVVCQILATVAEAIQDAAPPVEQGGRPTWQAAIEAAAEVFDDYPTGFRRVAANLLAMSAPHELARRFDRLAMTCGAVLWRVALDDMLLDGEGERLSRCWRPLAPRFLPVSKALSRYHLGGEDLDELVTSGRVTLYEIPGREPLVEEAVLAAIPPSLARSVRVDTATVLLEVDSDTAAALVGSGLMRSSESISGGVAHQRVTVDEVRNPRRLLASMAVPATTTLFDLLCRGELIRLTAAVAHLRIAGLDPAEWLQAIATGGVRAVAPEPLVAWEEGESLRPFAVYRNDLARYIAASGGDGAYIGSAESAAMRRARFLHVVDYIWERIRARNVRTAGPVGLATGWDLAAAASDVFARHAAVRRANG